MSRIDELVGKITDLKEELTICRSSVEHLTEKLSISEDRVDVLEAEADTPARDRRKEDKE